MEPGEGVIFEPARAYRLPEANVQVENYIKASFNIYSSCIFFTKTRAVLLFNTLIHAKIHYAVTFPHRIKIGI